MKKLLLSASLIALSIGAAFSQTNSITAGNAPSGSGKGYYFNFNGGIVDNNITANGNQYGTGGFAPMTIAGGSLVIPIASTSSTYQPNTDLLEFYSGNSTWTTIDLSSPVNQKFDLSLNASFASSTATGQLVVVFYNGTNSTYGTDALVYTITSGSNFITSTSQGNKMFFGTASNVDSSHVTGIGILIRGNCYNCPVNAGTYSIDYIAIGDTAVLGGTSTNTTTGITSQEIALANQVSIYPNPATDNITVDLSLFPGGADVKILTSAGATIAEQNAQGSATFPVGNLTKGLYFIQISSDNLVVQKKFIHD